MEQRYANKDPFAAVIRSLREEIEKYRWIESEKRGYDVGWQRAEREWKEKHKRAWRGSLRSRGLLHPLLELLWSQQEEIERFKWIESERCGRDIGWAHAVRAWQEKHYEAWRQHVLRPAVPVTGARVPPSKERSRRLSDEHRAKLSTSMKAWSDRRKAAKSDCSTSLR